MRPETNRHSRKPTEHLISLIITGIIHAGIFLLFALSSGSESQQTESTPANTIFCRYIDNGRFFQVEVSAADWQEAEERICGADMRDVRLGPVLLEGALLILENRPNSVIYAQRESCSCSSEEKVPILQDVSIVEAPRLGAETKKTALPRIINTPEPTQANTVTTNKTEKQKKDEKPAKKASTSSDPGRRTTRTRRRSPIFSTPRRNSTKRAPSAISIPADPSTVQDYPNPRQARAIPIFRK